MPDPTRSKVYLRPLSGEYVPAQYSAGARRRAVQLQRFLEELHGAVGQRVEIGGALELLVVNRSDWGRLFSNPYGVPITRTGTDWGRIVAVADYPLRFLHRFDEALLRAGRAGRRVPGDVRELLDLWIGHEWGRASAHLLGLRTRIKWFDELIASYFFQLALRDSGADGTWKRLLAWSELGVASGDMPSLEGGLHEGTRAKVSPDRLMASRSQVTLEAADLVERRGWEFLQRARAALSDGGKREAVAALVELEPSLKLLGADQTLNGQ
jgi:hypothetical protein